MLLAECLAWVFKSRLHFDHLVKANKVVKINKTDKINREF